MVVGIGIYIDAKFRSSCHLGTVQNLFAKMSLVVKIVSKSQMFAIKIE